MGRKTRFIDACFGRKTDCTPVWLMRQAGRYQASYRSLREKVSFFDLCQTPELAAQVTVNAVRELGVDAAILFSDILIILEPMGAEVKFIEKGPSIATPIRTSSDVQALRALDPHASVPFVMEAIRMVRRELDQEVPLIGFAGGPLTLASYLVEGGQSKNFTRLKKMLFCAPQIAHQLLDKLADSVAAHLKAQIDAGCQAVQIFDSWAGILGPKDYQTFVVPYIQKIMEEIFVPGVPRILFSTCNASLIEVMQTCGPDVLGLDWRIPLDVARSRLGAQVALQGNLDPACLFMEEKELENRIAQMLHLAGGQGGYIFNLGHGVLPEIEEHKVKFLVDTVHRLSRR